MSLDSVPPRQTRVADAGAVRTLIEALLDVEELDSCLFRGCGLWTPPGARGVFGGHVIGQALVACSRTVDSEKKIHSMHSYFLLPGDSQKDIIYTVCRAESVQRYTPAGHAPKQRARVDRVFRVAGDTVARRQVLCYPWARCKPARTPDFSVCGVVSCHGTKSRVASVPHAISTRA